MEKLYIEYAKGLLLEAKEENLDLKMLRNQIDVLSQIFKKEPGFAGFLSNSLINLDEKYKVIDNTFKDFDSLIIRFIKLITLNGRGIYIYDIFRFSLRQFDEFLGIEKGIIYSAKPLSNENIEKITNVLKEIKNKDVVLKNEIDESLIGGIKVCLQNDIFDASIAKSLKNIKVLLKGDN